MKNVFIWLLRIISSIFLVLAIFYIFGFLWPFLIFIFLFALVSALVEKLSGNTPDESEFC